MITFSMIKSTSFKIATNLFLHNPSQVLIDIVSIEHPGSETVKTFYSAWKALTDYGPCCLISPFLNFANKETKDISPSDYTAAHWHSQPKGSHNGQSGGIKFLLDVESFDFSFSGEESFGFRVDFSDQRDKSIIKQDGYLISPGILLTNFKQLDGS
jgi:hypothetical protein